MTPLSPQQLYIHDLLTQHPTDLAILLLSSTILITILLQIVPHSGFTRTEATLLLGTNITGILLPVHLFNITLLTTDTTTIYLNLFGAGIPLLFCLLFYTQNKIGPTEAATALLVTTYVAYELTYTDTTRGIIVTNFILIPLIAALVAILIHRALHKATIPLTYFASVLGILIGADILNLATHPSLHAAGLAIGGNGAIDAVFMAGIIAIVLDIALNLTLTKKQRHRIPPWTRPPETLTRSTPHHKQRTKNSHHSDPRREPGNRGILNRNSSRTPLSSFLPFLAIYVIGRRRGDAVLKSVAIIAGLFYASHLVFDFFQAGLIPFYPVDTTWIKLTGTLHLDGIHPVIGLDTELTDVPKGGRSPARPLSLISPNSLGVAVFSLPLMVYVGVKGGCE